jgi:hypothetical protein
MRESIKMSALLIFNNIPENVDFYILPDHVHEKYKHFLVEAHGKLLNCHEMNKGMGFLDVALTKEKLPFCDGGFSSEELDQYSGIFVQYKVDNSKPFKFDGGNIYSAGANFL